MQRIALEGLVSEGATDDFSAVWWFSPFAEDHEAFAIGLLPVLMERGHREEGCAIVHRNVPLPLPEGEPAGVQLGLSGVAGAVSLAPEGNMLVAVWPDIEAGAEEIVRVTGIALSPDRLQGLVRGLIDEDLEICWFDRRFVPDRGFHAVGSVHRVLLAGIAHSYTQDMPPPIRIGPEADAYESLREIAPDSVGEDGFIEIRTDRMAAIFPIFDQPPNFYDVCGPIKAIRRIHALYLPGDVWAVRVCVARIGDGHEREVDIDVILSTEVRDGRRLPRLGEQIRAVVQLYGRIWQPNCEG